MAIWKKLSLLIFLSALLPLLIFGNIAMRRAARAQYDTISQGNSLVAERSAEQIGQYVMNIRRILRALSENINRPGVDRTLQEGIVRNYIINFKQFQEISLVNRQKKTVLSQGVVSGERGTLRDAVVDKALTGEEADSDVFIAQSMTPAMFTAVPMKRLAGISGALVAQVNLVEMWNLVDSLKIGRKGHAMVVSGSGLLIAHGSGPGKARVLQGQNVADIEIVKSALSGASKTLVYRDDHSKNGEEVLGVSAPIPGTGWVIVIEQPTSEAYIPARAIAYQLAGLAVVFLILSLIAGFVMSGEIVSPIKSLMAGVRAIASGDLKARVDIGSRDEFGELGRSFNGMAEKLIKLQEDVRLKERTATFGRIAQGLVHDIKNPVIGIQMALNGLKKSPDKEYLALFTKNLEETLSFINTLLENLRDIYRKHTLELVPLNLEKELTRSIDRFAAEAREQGVEMKREGMAANGHMNGLNIKADPFALRRVADNIIRNAIEAMPDGGTLSVRVDAVGEEVNVSFADTGVGIPSERLATLFMDYTTTKRKGFGLGLALCKRLMEEMGGDIAAESWEGSGTTFTLTFQRSPI